MNIASSSELRNRAWDAMKATWQTVTLVTFVISLVSYVASAVLGAIPLIGSFFTLLASVVVAVPTMGRVKGTMDVVRGRFITFECITSMFPYWKEVIKLTLWTGLCLVGWMLLGMLATFVLGLVLSLIGGGENAQLVVLAVGMAVMLTLIFRAVLNYSMANCILVDNPGVGSRNALRQSKEMIKGYRWHYIKIGLPIALLVVLISAIGTLLSNLLPLMLVSFITSILSIAPNVASCYFMPVVYEELRRIGR